MNEYITIKRAELEQALEALEAFLSDELRPYEAAKASAVLRAALAQQALPAESVAMYETDVQLVEKLPELHLLYVQNSHGTRFAVDQDTEIQTELLPGVTYRAQVNAEGYALKISRLHDIIDSNKDT